MKELQQSPHEPLDPTRREFTAEALLALLMGCVITVSEACSDNNPSTPTPTSTPTDINGVISANHGHTVTITGAQISAGTALVGIHIQGTATHDHTIAVAQTEMQTLANRQSITVTSTTDAMHNHNVTFTPM